MKFYNSYPRKIFMQVQKKKETAREIPLSWIISFLFAIIYYPFQYGRMLAYGIISFNYLSDWKGLIPQIIIFSAVSAIMFLFCILFVKLFARSDGIRICCLFIVFLILNVIYKEIIIYISVILAIVGIYLLLYDFMKGFKNKSLLYIFKDIVPMTALLIIISAITFFCPQIPRFIFSNELVAALITLFVLVFFPIECLSLIAYYAIDKITYKNILDSTFKLKLDNVINLIKDWIARTEIVILLIIVLLTGVFSIFYGYISSELSSTYLINSEYIDDGNKSVEVVVYDSGEYYCLETADLLSKKDGLVSIIIYKNSYRWTRKDAIQTRSIHVFSSKIQES